jgi:hypothetical protein
MTETLVPVGNMKFGVRTEGPLVLFRAIFSSSASHGYSCSLEQADELVREFKRAISAAKRARKKAKKEEE